MSGRVLRPPDPAPHLKRLTLPVLVVTANRDQPAFRAMAGEYRDALPQSRFEQLDAGHMAPSECPDEFNALLRNFLSQAG